jgi:hypothetical protein
MTDDTAKDDWDAPAVELKRVRCISVDRPHVPHTDGFGVEITRGLKHGEEVDVSVEMAAKLLKNRHVELV